MKTKFTLAALAIAVLVIISTFTFANFKKAAAPHALAKTQQRGPVPKDSDNDGIPDPLDKCPNTPLGVIVDSHGCPLDLGGGGTSDSDHDGVIDAFDLCPGTPAGTPVDADGCPVQ